MNWKIARDPYLGPLCARWGEQAVAEAGFFVDADPTDATLTDTDWLCTPTAVVRRHVAAGDPRAGAEPRRPVVLVSTGGFFPVHDGHLAMMAAARRAAEGAGWWVVGGYLSPGHDDYLTLKCGELAIGASARIERVAASIDRAGASARWLSVDPWEALGRRVSVNFTDVTARLETYLRAWVDPEIDVAFVCGGDNARFALAFAERGACVVVGRPGHAATVARWRADPRLVGHDRILWTGGTDPTSSTSLRPVATTAPTPRLVLRTEDARSVATLGLTPAAWRSFQSGLVAQLTARLAVESISVDAQHDVRVARTISLDPLLPGEVVLGVSRLFDLGGYRQVGHVARPGSPALDEQFAAIPAGEWTLRDDDRSTGSTIAFVRSRLRPEVRVIATTFATAPAEAAHEIADSRDFLIGADDGGLVLALPNGAIGRAPYVLPFVDPAVRGGLPASESLAFSLAVWELNAEVFAPTSLTVADLPLPAATTLRATGATSSTRLADVCRRHADVLTHLLALPR